MGTSKLILLTGVAGIFFHEALYRRTIDPHKTDYELGGLVTHAAIDMAILTVIIAAVVWIAGSRK